MYFTKLEKGNLGERYVKKVLLGRGYTFIGSNIRISNFGEIDLIFKDRIGKYMFIEVRTKVSKYNPKYSHHDLSDMSTGITDYTIGDMFPVKKLFRFVRATSLYCVGHGLDFDSQSLFLVSVLISGVATNFTARKYRFVMNATNISDFRF